MKKFFAKLALFLLPFLLVVVFFFVFETYDYWDLKGSCDYTSRSIHALREVQLAHPTRIILGDSRMANVNTGYLEEITGQKWSNLAYGGATLEENIRQFWYTAERTDLEQVVIGVTFYTLNDDHVSTARFPAAQKVADDPLTFLGTFKYWGEAFDNFKNILSNGLYRLTGNTRFQYVKDDPSSLTQDTPVPTAYGPDGYRTDLETYAGVIYDQCSGYSGSVHYLAELQEIIDYCDANNIELTFVLPACNRTIWDKVVAPLDIAFYMDIYKDYLKSRAAVFDMEFYSDYAADDANFLDGFHFSLTEKLHMTRIFFGGEDSPYCMKTTPQEYAALKSSGELAPLLAQYNSAAPANFFANAS